MKSIALPICLAALALSSCKSDPPPKTTRSVSDQRDAVVEEKAPASQPQPVTNSPATQPVVNKRVEFQQKLYNRVIARNATVADVDALKLQVTAATGAEIEKIRPGALGMMSIVFVQTDPPRTAEQQADLVEKLKAAKLFETVEAEKMMTAK